MKSLMKLFIKVIAFIIYPFYVTYNAIQASLINRIKLQLLILKLKTCDAQIGNSLLVGKRVNISIKKGAKLIIGKNVVIGDDVYIKVRKNAILKIGDNTHLNKGTRVSSFESIIIGKHTLIASYCNILDHNHQFDLKSPVSTKHFDCSPIEIQEGTWLGTKVQVNKGSSIGKYCVIAANSVVTTNIPDSCVYGGIPAKLIKSIDE